jgi:hypothetical protein
MLARAIMLIIITITILIIIIIAITIIIIIIITPPNKITLTFAPISMPILYNTPLTRPNTLLPQDMLNSCADVPAQGDVEYGKTVLLLGVGQYQRALERPQLAPCGKTSTGSRVRSATHCA